MSRIEPDSTSQFHFHSFFFLLRINCNCTFQYVLFLNTRFSLDFRRKGRKPDQGHKSQPRVPPPDYPTGKVHRFSYLSGNIPGYGTFFPVRPWFVGLVYSRFYVFGFFRVPFGLSFCPRPGFRYWIERNSKIRVTKWRDLELKKVDIVRRWDRGDNYNIPS